MIETHTTTEPSEMPAFDEIYRLYYHQIKAYLYKRTNNMALAEDLTQDVFTKIYSIFTKPEHADRRPKTGKLKAWLYECATNKFLDHIRSADSRVMAYAESTEILAENDSGVLRSEHQNPIHQALLKQANSALYGGIRSLKDEQRDVMICRHVLGLSIPETATYLRINEGTVKSREHRAKEALLRWYKQQNATALPEDFLP